MRPGAASVASSILVSYCGGGCLLRSWLPAGHEKKSVAFMDNYFAVIDKSKSVDLSTTAGQIVTHNTHRRTVCRARRDKVWNNAGWISH